MSEFTDGYLLRGTAGDAKKLITATRRFGLILSTNSGPFVPFLVEGLADVGHASDVVIEHNPGVLLHMSFAVDHGLWVAAFEQQTPVFTLDLQRRGPSDNFVALVAKEAQRLALVAPNKLDGFRTWLRLTNTALDVDVTAERDTLSSYLGTGLDLRASCMDLSRLGLRDLEAAFPGGTLVLSSRRKKVETETAIQANEWCPVPGMPSFMYLAVPAHEVDELMLERHIDHWLDTGDFDEERQAGFWLLNAYKKFLPTRWSFLADRMMNLNAVFIDDGEYQLANRNTLRGILSVASKDADWEPYLARRAGEQRV